METHPSNPTSNTMTATLPLLLDVAETARLLNVSVRFVRILGARGSLPLVRLGRRTLVRRADLDALVARGRLADVG
jgi:excisionase family DNA binding protein